jgi:RNA polymerase primary sigma factor
LKPPAKATSPRRFDKLTALEVADRIAMANELRRRLQIVMKTLSHREREILKLRYGLDDGYPYTLDEVAHIFKVTRDRIRQIEFKAVRKLQQPNRSRQLADFLE